MNLLYRLARQTPALALAGIGSIASAATVDVAVTGADHKPLAHAVVFLESPAARAAFKPADGAEIAQQNKRFVTPVNVVPVGTAVQFPNRDAVRHHVYSFSPTKTFELKLYAGTPANPVVFDRAGIAVLGCNIHDSMAAWVVVVETPYYAQTGDAGTVKLADVPPGSYRLRAWHPALPVGAPALDVALTVADPAARASVEIPVDGSMAP